VICKHASLLSLSPELIEEIALYLRVRDSLSLALSRRRLRNIVSGSPLLQYAYCIELAGVLSATRFLTAFHSQPYGSLRRWEAPWNNLRRYFSATPPQPRLVIPAERDLFGPYFLRDDYLFAVDWQGHPTGLRQLALLYVNLRDALRTSQHNWRRVDYPKGSNAITQAFSFEEDYLSVSVLR